MPSQARRPERDVAFGQTFVPDADALLGRVARGDERAFELLYDLAAPAVHGLARRILRDQAFAEEVTQEVLIEVWRTATRYDPARGGAMAWIITIAHRRAVDRVRREQTAYDRETQAARAEHTIAYDPVSERVETMLEHERVRGCLGSLTTLQQEALILAYYSGYTYREVAERVGAPPNTVRTRLRDAIVRLRGCMGVAR